MPGRIAQAKQTLARYDATNPHTAGRIRQTLGGVLIADGLVGLENPLNGRKTRPGLLGSIFGIFFSAIFVAVPFFILKEIRNERNAGTDPAFNDPFFTDPTSPGFSGPSTGGPPEFFDWVLYFFIAIGVLLAFSAVLTTLIRLASIIFGIVLLRSGNRMVAANPATPDDPGLINEARERLTRILTAPSTGILGALGVGHAVSNNRTGRSSFNHANGGFGHDSSTGFSTGSSSDSSFGGTD